MRKQATTAFQKVMGVVLALCLLLLPTLSSLAEITLANVTVDAAPLTSASSSINGMVRVYLSSLGSPTTLTLSVSGSYSLSTGTSLSNGDTLTVGFSSSSGSITLTRNGSKTNMGNYFAIRRHSSASSGGIKISQARKPGNPYPGDMIFRSVYQSGGYYKLYTIANVYIEDYLYGVLPYEMGGSAPSEALKAQAVAARTYTVRMMQSRASGYYDVVDTTSDQTYNGTPTGYASCVSAVNATKGIVLKNGSSYTATYYSASNGGQTESIKNIWGSSGYSYLNVHDDPFDYANPDSTVKKTTVYANCSSSYNNSSLMSLLKTKAVSALRNSGYSATSANTTLGTIQSIVVHTPMYNSPSRLYTKMDFTLTAGTVNSSGSSVTATTTVTCSIFSELESMLSMSIQSSQNELWSVQKSGSTFTLEARRYGHGLGLSQRGAMYMGKLGYTYDEILGFYYPDCTRVGTTFTNTILAADSSEEITTEEEAADIEDGGSDDGCAAVVSLVSSGTSLAIRASKSTSGTLLGVIPNSSPVTVLSSDGTWCLVKFGQIVGYVPKNALTISGTIPDETDESITGIAGFATVSVSGYLNLRESGSYSATVVTTAPDGAVFTVFSKGTEWAKIQYGATVAYACTDYLVFSDTYPNSVVSSGASTATVTDSDGAVLRATASTTGTVLAQLAYGASVTVSKDDGSWCTVSYNGVSGYMLSASLALGDDTDVETGSDDGSGGNDTGADTATVATQSGSLNMRQSASAGSTILTTIPKGASVTVTNRGNTWCGVTYGGYSGYVMTVFLAFSDDAGADDEDTTIETTATVTTASGSLNLRLLPKTGSTILTTIPRLETITVHTYGADWCYVTYNNITGYVMTVFLTLQESDDTTSDDDEDAVDDGSAGEAADESPSEDASDDEDTQDEESGDDDSQDDEPEDSDDSQSDTGTETAIVTTASGSLNLRADMLPGSRILTRIPNGTTIVVLQKLSAWTNTTYNGYTGYVVNSYLTFLSDTADTSAVTATVVTSSGSLNLRSEPYGKVLTTIPQYATAQVIQRGSTWCYLTYAGVYGYAMTAYLSISEDTEAADTGGDAADDSTDDSSDDSQDDTEEDTPDDTQDDTADEGGDTGELTAYVLTTSGSLNLRAYESTSAKILTTIPRLATVSVPEKGDVWSSVVYGSYSGYVQTVYLCFDDASADTQGDDTVAAWVYTTSGSLNLRASASASAAVLTVIPRLAEVTLMSQGSTWCKTQYGAYIGYAMTRYLTTVKPSELGGGSQDDESDTDEEDTTDATASDEPDTSDSSQETAEDETDAGESADEDYAAADSSGEIDEDPTLTAPNTPLYATITPPGDAATLALWEACSEQSGRILDMDADSRVQVLRAGNEWCEVLYADQTGFCYTKGLTMLGS